MQFAQGRDLVVCDYVAAIQMCIVEITTCYVDDSVAFSQDIFCNFKTLSSMKHDAIPRAWVPKALNLNFDGLDYLHFTPSTHSIQATPTLEPLSQ
jgi:hypothetical protein